MNNKINKTFSAGKPVLMTHVVCGYPREETTLDLVKTMEDSGADLIEIQIPFSDPLADGPTIMRANKIALDNGMNVDKSFRIMEKLASSSTIPLLFMTYGNIPFVRGVENFINDSADAGASGLIIPDIPFDEGMNLFEKSGKRGMDLIPVVSPDISEQRLVGICSRARGFIYATLKVGITGSSDAVSTGGIDFIEKLRSISNVPVGAGFGISSPAQVKAVWRHADCTIVGSRLIEVYDTEGLKGVSRFIKACRNR